MGSAYIRKGDRKWNRYCLLLTMIGAGVYIRESETVRDKYSTPNGEVEGGGSGKANSKIVLIDLWRRRQGKEQRCQKGRKFY